MEQLTITPFVPPQHGLHLAGELDMATVTQFRTALEAVSGDGSVTLDMGQLTFIDSSGLYAIMEFVRSLNGNGPLILASPTPTARRAIAIAGLDAQAGVEVN